MREKIENIIIEVLKELNEELENESFNEPNLKTKLYGGGSGMDSLSLVSFITDVEERISDEFDADIVLADEKAMSAATSPFRNIESLALYIENLLEDK